MEDPGAGAPLLRLAIIVAAGCAAGCAAGREARREARRMAAEMTVRFPAVAVSVRELDGQRPGPPGVIATPGYLLNGKIFSFANPYRDALAAAILRRQESRQ